MKKKQRKTPFSRMPLDCWGLVINHFTEKSDLLSLSFVVKGLWHFINFINPPSTRNVKFELISIPKKGKFYVTNLSFKSKSFIEKKHNHVEIIEQKVELLFNSFVRKNITLKSFQCHSIGDFMGKLLQVFTNLITLDCDFESVSFETSKSRKLRIHFGNILDSHSHLKHLCLRIPKDFNASFSPPKLPCLHSLSIERHSEKYDDVYNDNVAELELQNLENISQLRSLSLKCWNMKTSFWEIKKVCKQLEEICLNHTTPVEYRITGFETLKSLELLDCGVSSFQSIKKCPKLERLVFCDRSSWTSHVVDKKVNIGIIGILPSLKILHFYITSCETTYAKGKKFDVSPSCFPSLEEFHLRVNAMDLTFSIDHGNISHLYLDCERTNVEIVNISGLRRLMFKGTSLPNDLQEAVFSSSSSKTNLESVDLEVTKTDEEVNSRTISFIDFQKLKLIRYRGKITVKWIMNCPSLEYIDVWNDHGEDPNETRGLKYLRKLDNLKCITLKDLGYDRYPFVQKIYGLDCRNIVLDCDNFLGHRTYSLEKYISLMKEKGVVIENF